MFVRPLIALFVLFILSYSPCTSELAEDVIEKDLYKVLGLQGSATKKEIKDAYRRLAKVHHPDKSAPKDRDMNAKVFRDVAEAYEVLSSEAGRREYDNRRSFHRSSEQYFNSFERPSDYHQRDRRRSTHQYEQHYPPQEDFDDQAFMYEQAHMEQAYMEYMHKYAESMRHFEEYLYQQERAYMEHMSDEGKEYIYEEGRASQQMAPFLVGSHMQEGDVLFPYSPILTASDGSHFALLDGACRFVVYEGDPGRFLQELYVSGGDLSRLSWGQYRELYSSPSHEELESQCFAGLDRGGTFKIFRGHPDAYNYFEPIWRTERQDDDDFDDELGNMVREFFLDLSSTGEASIRSVTLGDAQSQCIWSTLSCNEVLSIVKDAWNDVRGVLGALPVRLNYARRVLREVRQTRGRMGVVVVVLRSTLFSVAHTALTLVRTLVRWGMGHEDEDI